MRQVIYLGSLKEWLVPIFSTEDIGYIRVLPGETSKKYIPVLISFKGDVSIRLSCSKTLSDQIRSGEINQNQLLNSFVVKVVTEKGKTLIRLTHFFVI